MALEPAVENCIKEHRAKARRKTLRFMIPVTLGFVMIGIRVIPMTIMMGNTHTSVSGVSGIPDTRLFILLPVLFMGLVMLGVSFGTMRPFQKQYDEFTRPLDTFDRVALGRWQDGLEAASLGVGITPPVIVPIALPTANTISFEFGGKMAVGVSAEALAAPLSYPEVEAIMAHEVAHIVTKTHIHSPYLRHKRYLLIALAVTGVLSLALFVWSPWFMIAPFLLVAATPMMLIPTAMRNYQPIMVNTQGPYGNQQGSRISPEMMKDAHYEYDIIADSIAAKIISEPQALRRAIGEMAGLMKSSPVMPSQKMTYTYLFIGPFRAWEPEVIKKAPLMSRRMMDKLVQQSYENIETYIRTRHDLISDRLMNLKEIEAGVWRVFEQASGGQVVTEVAGWE